MTKKSIPRFYGLRIYLSTTLLYFFLIIPFLIFLAVQNIPQFVVKQQTLRREPPAADSVKKAGGMQFLVDSLAVALDSVRISNAETFDTLLERTARIGETLVDTIEKGRIGSPMQVTVEDQGG